MTQAVFDRLFTHFQALEEQRETWRLATAPQAPRPTTDLSAYRPPDPYSTEPPRRLTTAVVEQPTDLSAYLPPDPWGDKEQR
ncbi:MAG TPA: hypothetical protein VM165_16685 [Planctomycetaceae bacterium]|nr:hypothetical protein [Planctomycetaceae bacterium]